MKSANSVFLCILLLILGASAPQTKPYDLIIRGGRIVDGSGNPWYEADVGIRNGRIATIGRLDNSEAARVLDGKGLIVAPGFIDVHTHVEGSIRRLPTADNFLFNGVTSIVTGNCGGSETQLDSFFTQLRSTGISLNLGTLVGHNSVRASVMGSVQRDPTPREQAQMEALVERAMRVGAMGFSTGLIYIPGTYSKTPEVVGLARAAAKSGGVYASHIRDEETEVFEAIDEALHVGREAGMPVQISHFKVSSKLMWGATAQTIEKVEQARAEGLDVTVDQYPYTASSTNLGVLVPSWALAGGQAALNRHLADPATREKIVAEMDRDFRERHGFDRIDYAVVASCTWNRSLEGKSIARINAEKGRQETLQAEIETVIEMMQQGGAQMIYHKMHEADVERVLRFPYSMVASDSDIRSFGAGMPHPRGYGTNARVLGRYVREKKVIRLEEAIRKMTSLPAQRFRFEDRGLIRPSMWADIAVFDEQTVGDKATFEKPHAYSEGFRFVLVNGQIVIEDGKHTGARPGQVILGRGVSTLSNSTPE